MGLLYDMADAFVRFMDASPGILAVFLLWRCRRPLGRITAQIHALSLRPSAGEVSFGAERATARDVLLVALAGPLASLGGTVICAVLLSAAPTSGLVHDLLWCSVAGGLLGVLNLLPFTLRDRSGAIQSDGRVAFDALRVVRQLS